VLKRPDFRWPAPCSFPLPPRDPHRAAAGGTGSGSQQSLARTDLPWAIRPMPLPADQGCFLPESCQFSYTPLATSRLPQHSQESLWTYCSVRFGRGWLKLSEPVKVGRGMNWCGHRQCSHKDLICFENYSHLDLFHTQTHMGIETALEKTFNKACQFQVISFSWLMVLNYISKCLTQRYTIKCSYVTIHKKHILDSDRKRKSLLCSES